MGASGVLRGVRKRRLKLGFRVTDRGHIFILCQLGHYVSQSDTQGLFSKYSPVVYFKQLIVIITFINIIESEGGASTKHGKMIRVLERRRFHEIDMMKTILRL